MAVIIVVFNATDLSNKARHQLVTLACQRVVFLLLPQSCPTRAEPDWQTSYDAELGLTFTGTSTIFTRKE